MNNIFLKFYWDIKIKKMKKMIENVKTLKETMIFVKTDDFSWI